MERAVFGPPVLFGGVCVQEIRGEDHNRKGIGLVVSDRDLRRKFPQQSLHQFRRQLIVMHNDLIRIEA
ncbi:hypothetical protein M2308_002555 [Rhizobium leguminosarum]|nr:hypothetical protein [Rhizobium leguminosarum]